MNSGSEVNLRSLTYNLELYICKTNIGVLKIDVFILSTNKIVLAIFFLEIS